MIVGSWSSGWLGVCLSGVGEQATAIADPCGMTNKRTGKSKGKDKGKSEIRGSFAALRMTDI